MGPNVWTSVEGSDSHIIHSTMPFLRLATSGLPADLRTSGMDGARARPGARGERQHHIYPAWVKCRSRGR